MDQAKNNDFRPFGPVVHKITKRRVDPAYEVYLALYQAVTGTEEWQKIYRLVPLDDVDNDGAGEDGLDGTDDEGTDGGVIFTSSTGGGQNKFVVDDVGVTVLAEREQYYDAQGRLVIETLRDYSRR